MYTLEDVQKKVKELCDINGYGNDEKILANCFEIINKYLSFKKSSIDALYNYLQDSIDNYSWLLAWIKINEEIDKLSGKFYIERAKQTEEQQKILLDYEPIKLGDRFFNEAELKKIRVNLGVIDAFGVFHTSERKNASHNSWPDHRKLANYLKLHKKIEQYYIRVGCMCGENDGILCAESLLYGNTNSLKYFLLTEKMAIALYNAIMSKQDRRFSTFEEKLAYYGTEFGYYSNKYNIIPQIYDNKLFNNNIKVLSYALGKKFDKKFFVEILNR